MSKGTADTDPRPGYILGHSEREIARLRAQAAQVDPITRRFLCEAAHGLGLRAFLDVAFAGSDPRESEAPVGLLRHLGPTVRLSETPPRWARPSVPLGYNQPVWPARAAA